MIRHQIGTNDDGTPRYHYVPEDHEQGEETSFLFTGPIAGTLSLPTGAAYDVSEPVISCKSEHLAGLQRAIHQAHHAAGRFLDVPLPDAE